MKILALLLTVGMVAILAILIAVRIQRGGGNARFVRRRVLNAAEHVLHHRLQLALSPQFHILVHVNFASFIGAEGGAELENSILRGKARGKVADFVVCDHAFHPLCVIELDGRKPGVERDTVRDDIIRQAGIGLLRYNVQAIPKPEQIRGDFARTRAQGARLEIYGGGASETAASHTAPV
jgi:hypothetical protein